MGEPHRYIVGHNARAQHSNNWKGGRFVSPAGYAYVMFPTHPHANVIGRVSEHKIAVENALHRLMPKSAIFHHKNHIRDDNAPSNIVVCDSQAYHQIIHRRERAFRAVGNANWRRCTICKEYDAPENLVWSSQRAKETMRHRRCAAEYKRRLRAAA